MAITYPTDAQLQAYIPVKIGDTTGQVAANMTMIWNLYSGYAPKELQYNYALVESIELLLGGNWQDVSWTGDGRSAQDQQQFANLISMASRADARIKQLLKARSVVQVQVGQLTTTSIIPSPNSPPGPDANDPRYGGDPNTPWPYGKDIGSGWW